MRKLPILMLLYVLTCHAWNSTGHCIVAQIAYDQLNHRIDNFVNSAAWADNIRSAGNKNYNNWHFIDLPYVIGPHRSLPLNSYNVVWAIHYCMRNLKGRQFYLKMLIHLIGDIHQPLHCIMRYDSQFPRGDYAGNLVKIKVRGEVMSLHSYWDTGVGLYPHYLRGWQVRKLAHSLEQHYPPSYFAEQLQDQDPEHWAEHSFQLAKQYAYTVPVNAVYIRQARLVVMQQLTLAGYRLAQQLKYHYE